MEDMNRCRKEGERKFSIPLYWLLPCLCMLILRRCILGQVWRKNEQTNYRDRQENAVKGEKPTKKGGGCMVVPSWWPCASNRGSSVPVWITGNAWQAGVKTFRQQVGIHGQENRKIPLLWSGWRKVMMSHVMFRSDRKTYGCNILGSEWESYGWTFLQYGCYMDHVQAKHYATPDRTAEELYQAMERTLRGSC